MSCMKYQLQSYPLLLSMLWCHDKLCVVGFLRSIVLHSCSEIKMCILFLPGLECMYV